MSQLLIKGIFFLTAVEEVLIAARIIFAAAVSFGLQNRGMKPVTQHSQFVTDIH